MSPTIDKSYLSGKSPLTISREMYDWTGEEGGTAPPSRNTLQKARLANKKRSSLDTLAYYFPTFSPSFEAPRKLFCEEIIKSLEDFFFVHVKTPIDEIKRAPKKEIISHIDYYLNDFMSLTWADVEYLEGRLPRPVFDAVVDYLKNPEVIKKYESVGGLFGSGFDWHKRFVRYFDKE